MADTKPVPLLTKNHQQLRKIASIANIFIFIVLAVTLFYSIDVILRAYNSFMMNIQRYPSFWLMLLRNPAYTIGLFLDILTRLAWGSSIALILKGISLGLNMIVETDLNYRLASQGENHE